jgi:SAM-dependent methyltransferase
MPGKELVTGMDWHARFAQQARWTKDIRRYLFERIGLTTGQRLLEVGCGTGAVLSGFPETGCQIHGLDIDRGFLLQAEKYVTAAQLTQGDAHRLPYPGDSFDFACCHYLLLWVANPAQVLREMWRVVRAGGWVMALAEPDYGGRIDFPEDFIKLGRLQETALRRQGAETRLGRQLSGLFHTAGFQEVETGLLGGQWRGSPPADDVEQEWQVIQADLTEDLSPGELAQFRRLEAEAWKRGDRVLYVPTFYAVGKK